MKHFSKAILILLCTATIRAATPVTQSIAMEPQSRREAFLKIIDRPEVDPAPEQSAAKTVDGSSEIHFAFSSEATQRVPGILVGKAESFTDGRRHPAVVVLHGTGGKKEAEMTTLKELAAVGMIGVAVDARYHGERGNQTQYNAAIAQAFADGKSHPLYYDEVWDMMRLIDYLQSRPEIDSARIGLIGISKGGIETWLTAAVDPRVAVAVPCISAQSFDWGLHNDRWHGRISTVQKGFDMAAKAADIERPDAVFVRRFYDRLLPGIYTEFDGPEMLPLIAPRPLLLINGDQDPLNPVEGLKLCEQATVSAYAQKPERFKVILQPHTGHTVLPASRSAAIEWFSKWLGN